MKFAVIASAFLNMTLGCSGLPENPAEYSAWQNRSLEAIGKLSTRPPDEAIPELALRMIQLSRQHTPNWEKGDRPVFHAAQKALLSIPGHAEYYRDRIVEKRLEYEAVKDGQSLTRESEQRFALSNTQINGFRTMAYLPSVETVRVLGEFLTDERGYIKLPPNPTQDDMEATAGLYPNCKMAARALSTLPFVSKPLHKKWSNITYEDVQPWKLWYEQIKAGNRTFRFEGDPTEYDLDGPAPKEKLQRIERDRKRDEERTTGEKKTSLPASEDAASITPANRSLSTAGLLIASALCAAAVWYSLKDRTAA